MWIPYSRGTLWYLALFIQERFTIEILSLVCVQASKYLNDEDDNQRQIKLQNRSHVSTNSPQFLRSSINAHLKIFHTHSLSIFHSLSVCLSLSLSSFSPSLLNTLKLSYTHTRTHTHTYTQWEDYKTVSSMRNEHVQ